MGLGFRVFLPTCLSRGRLSDALLRLETRRTGLLSQLRRLYPICAAAAVSSGGAAPVVRYSIRDMMIPSPDDETISSALGFVCHLVLMIAKYDSVRYIRGVTPAAIADDDQIVLRYRIHHLGSRSTISDEVSPIRAAPVLQYPLYVKGVERAQFECAIILLNRVVDQVGVCSAVSYSDRSCSRSSVIAT